MIVGESHLLSDDARLGVATHRPNYFGRAARQRLLVNGRNGQIIFEVVLGYNRFTAAVYHPLDYFILAFEVPCLVSIQKLSFIFLQVVIASAVVS